MNCFGFFNTNLEIWAELLRLISTAQPQTEQQILIVLKANKRKFFAHIIIAKQMSFQPGSVFSASCHRNIRLPDWSLVTQKSQNEMTEGEWLMWMRVYRQSEWEKECIQEKWKKKHWKMMEIFLPCFVYFLPVFLIDFNIW